MKDLQNLDEATLQQLGFWDGFKKGFGMVMQPAGQIASAVGGATGIPEAQAAGQIFNGINGAVQGIGLQEQMELQDLGFSFKKFGRGFKKGFSSVMKPAAAITGALGKATGIPEVAMAGQVFNGANQAVNAIPVQMQELGFWNDFGKGFKKGFGMVMKPATAVFNAIPIPEFKAGGAALGAINAGVQSIPTRQQQLQLQQLGFWGDFGKGFKKGFGMVMKPAGAIASAVGGATGVPEAAAAGKIFTGLNGAVQSFN
jgi:hypothetical protein